MEIWWLWIIVFLLFLMPILTERRQQDIRRIIKKRRQKGLTNMSELIKNYIDKECILYLSGGSSAVQGIIRKAQDGWLEIEKQNGQTELLSLDYISRIQEYPRDKKGRKKTVIAD